MKLIRSEIKIGNSFMSTVDCVCVRFSSIKWHFFLKFQRKYSYKLYSTVSTFNVTAQEERKENNCLKFKHSGKSVTDNAKCDNCN